MIIKVGGEYLDFNETIEVEKQVKLFEEISTTDGDFSYEFTIPMTSNNVKILGSPFPDNNTKPVYQKIDCSLLGDNHLPIYNGYLKIEGIVNNEIVCSFFSGNSNWFGLLSGPLGDIDFSDLDFDQDIETMEDLLTANEGVVFPLVDNGTLVTRMEPMLKLEDFVAGVYVKTIFKRIFQKHGIKLQGELFNDPAYNSIITLKNSKSTEEIKANSSYVQKTSTTVRPTGTPIPSISPFVKVTFDNDTLYPYYDGDNDNFKLVDSKFVAPVRMRVEVDVILEADIINAAYNNRINFYINGVWPGFVDIGLPFGLGGLYNSGTPGDSEFFFMKRVITLEAGDELEIYSQWQNSEEATPNNVISGSIKITPLYIYKVFGNATIPNWSQQQYVSNILRLFNIIPSYDALSKTLNIDFLDKIKSKESIDLSEHISNVEVDYSAFISNYGKSNTLSYNEVDIEDLRDYNIQNFFKYSQGTIETNNELLPDSVSILESDFSNPIGYINPIFDMSLELTNLISLETDTSTKIVKVNDAGYAAFKLEDTILLVGDLVRISDSTNPLYNGDWVVAAYTELGYTFIGMQYNSDATGTITKLVHVYNDSDDVYLMWHIPNYPRTNISSKTIRIYDSPSTVTLTDISFAYFNLLNTGKQINEDYKQSLSFGRIDNELSYQRTLIDTYWSIIEAILNDPVELSCMAHLPYHIFLMIDFLRPIFLKTLSTTNMYYLNRISGYSGSEYPCNLSLIKLP